MTTTTLASPKRETLNLRIKTKERLLIDRAAKVQGKNRTEFVLDTLRAAAENVLMDQTYISVSHEAYDAFLERLDSPAQTNENLKKTMQTAAPWDKE
ncbi:MAG: DUF1778 domain-containing protein [Advenella sp.]